jgi:hypothetical protein
MKTEFFKWGILAACSTVILSLLVLLSVLYAPVATDDDPYLLVRYILLRLTGISIALPALTGLMLFVDFITPDDWMKAIGDDPKACSYVMSAVILVIGAVLCWT